MPPAPPPGEDNPDLYIPDIVKQFITHFYNQVMEKVCVYCNVLLYPNTTVALFVKLMFCKKAVCCDLCNMWVHMSYNLSLVGLIYDEVILPCILVCMS